MIDRDGIERPDKPDSHAIAFKHKKSKYRVTDKTYTPRSRFYRFMCFITRYIAVLFLSLIGKIKFRARSSSRKHYRQAKKTGGVIVCNHVHYFDVVLIASQLSPFKKVWITTIQSNMDIPVAGVLERVLGAMPIPDERSNMGKFISAIDSRLKRKHFVAFMPETALWPYYRDIRPFKISAFRFAAKNDVPVLPVTLTFRVKRKVKRSGDVKLKYKLHYDFLPPVYPDKEKSIPENTEEMLAATHSLMSANIQKRNHENYERYGV